MRPHFLGPRMKLFSSAARAILALQLHHQAVGVDPRKADSWNRLAGTEFFIGQLDTADFKRALARSPTVAARPYGVKLNLCGAGAAFPAIHFGQGDCPKILQLKSLLLILRGLGPISGPSKPPSCTQVVHNSRNEFMGPETRHGKLAAVC